MIKFSEHGRVKLQDLKLKKSFKISQTNTSEGAFGCILASMLSF